ncbi:FAD-dependent oxidoreductase [Roseovarius pacificus]|uniref:FAD-dependent oxidoreductase n=1 Tax=Roseovarius pacificus TaxID=337701 RepID=UPI002A189EF7|nr:FAD-dependent oxidoreductase [Roseovarius pacificus]
MMETDLRPSEELTADVFVAGGGAAGVAAAVTAARAGASVVLVERYGFCGGGAVAGLSGTLCGLYEATDKVDCAPRQVVFGFVEDFISEMERREGLTGPVRYGKTWTRVHDPLIWRESADALLASAGVRVIYHAEIVAALCDGNRVEGALISTVEGRLSIKARVCVDATGDGALAAMAGLETSMGHEGSVQNPTMVFRLMSADVSRFLAAYGNDSIMPVEVTEMITAANGQGYTLPRRKIWIFPTTRPNELMCNCTRIVGADGRELNATLWRDFTEAEIEGRKQAREYARFFRDRLTGCETTFLNDTGVEVGVRQTRQVKGRATLQNADVLAGTKFADGIARSPWPIELHSGAKPRVEWLLEDVYEVPFGCFVPVEGEGLLTAGRCLSAEHEAVASARVTAQCFSYGHAIGHAAALSALDSIATHAIDGRDIRNLLNRDGAALDS